MFNFERPITKRCPDCGMDHHQDVLQKERTQERIRTLRKALHMLCKRHGHSVAEVTEEAERKLYLIAEDLK